MKGGGFIKKAVRLLWAKKKDDNGRMLWLPLFQHLEDTRDVISCLWDRYLSEGQRALIEDCIEPSFRGRAKDLIEFVALIHDCGKTSAAFQTKSNFYSSDIDRIILENLEMAGFRDISSLKLMYANKSPHNITGQYLLHKYGVKDDIAAIIGAHHGKPVDYAFGDYEEDYLDQESYIENLYQNEDEASRVYQLWESCQKEIFDWALEEAGFKNVSDLPRIGEAAQVIILGLLVLADWIASNEEYFPLFDLYGEQALSKGSRKEGYYRWERNELWKVLKIEDIGKAYLDRFKFYPNEVQEIFSKLISETEEPGIFIFEAPMGKGKTEAALIGAEQLAFKKGCNGLFFGLPTQATSNGIFPRILNWLKNLESESEISSLRLSHSKAYLNDEFLKLSGNINVYGEESHKVIINQWFAGRRKTVLDEFVVGTIDQFLMVALKQKHLALRHLGFSKKVIILDEIHSFDAYMNTYLKQSLKWMGAYKIPVIMLSATLPAKTRGDLISAYMTGFGSKDINFTDIGGWDYPLVTYNDGEEIKQHRDFPRMEDKNVRVVKLKNENLIDLIEDLLSEGGVLGIILNTVSRVQKLGQDLLNHFGRDMVEVIHSAFIATDRIKKEEALIKMIGKNGSRPSKKIIVGTQVIEQSLDINFDVMISDLAPIDLLLQRIGRLHRHDIKRPFKLSEPTMYLVGCSDDLEFEEGSAYIYGGYLLSRTQYFMPDSLKIPSDISKLVQKVYGLDDLEFEDAKFKDKYDYFKKNNEILVKKKEIKASSYSLRDPYKKGNRRKETSLIGWLKNIIPEDSDERAYAQVRDIEDTIELIALKEIEGGYTLFDWDEDISFRISENDISREVAKNTFILPKAFSKAYNINKTIDWLEEYNMKYLRAWRDSIWLNGALGIIFNKDNEFELCNRKLIYDRKLGIMERK